MTGDNERELFEVQEPKPERSETLDEMIHRLEKEVKELKHNLLSVDKQIGRSMVSALRVLPIMDERHREGYIVGLRNFAFSLGSGYYNLFSKLENTHRNEVL